MFRPDKLYLERGIENHPLTVNIMAKLPDVPVEVVEDYKKIGFEKPFTERAETDKNCLALAEKKGDLIKNIGRMGEGQYYLFHEIDCRYDCEYCYLQYYFQTKVPVVFVNREDVLKEIEDILKTGENTYFHVGEVCDSLAMDDLTDFSRDVAKLFHRYSNATIEFRTKSTNVDNLVSMNIIASNIIPSWTLSPEYVADLLEHKTPSPKERLNAAKRCQLAGYTVGIRLDPVFIFAGWEDHYRKMVSDIFNVLDPEKIDYISLGSVKMHKNLIEAVGKRFPGSMVILEELVQGGDSKYRPLKFERVDMYNKMTSWIKSLAPGLEVKLSLESADVHALVRS